MKISNKYETLGGIGSVCDTLFYGKIIIRKENTVFKQAKGLKLNHFHFQDRVQIKDLAQATQRAHQSQHKEILQFNLQMKFRKQFYEHSIKRADEQSRTSTQQGNVNQDHNLIKLQKDE